MLNIRKDITIVTGDGKFVAIFFNGNLIGYVDPAHTALVKEPVKRAKAEAQATIDRDGVTWYGKVVNYTTGAKMAYTTFPVKAKRSKGRGDWRGHEVPDIIGALHGYRAGLKVLNAAYCNGNSLTQA